MQHNLRKRIYKWLDKQKKHYDVDFQTIDFHSLIDWSLTYDEIIGELEGNILLPYRKQRESLSDNEIRKLKKQHYQEVKEEAQKSIKTLSLKAENYVNLNTQTKQIIHTLLKSDKIHGGILYSSAGLGKSTLVLNVMEELNLTHGEDYILVSGYVTQLSFYQLLVENKDKKLIIFDDCDKLLEKDYFISMLKSALWSGFNKRTIQYHSTSDKLQEKSFSEFNAKIVICANKLNKNQHIDAVLSRCFYSELTITHEQKINIFHSIINNSELEDDQKAELNAFCNSLEPYMELDFRLPTKLIELMKYNSDWKKLAQNIIIINPKVKACVEAIEKYPNHIDSQVTYFKEMTGLGRTTFFKYKRKLSSAGELR